LALQLPILLALQAGWPEARRPRRPARVDDTPILLGWSRPAPSATPAASLPFTAGGWRDTTRIAAGDAELWADILLDNATPLAAAMRQIATASERLMAAIEAGDRRRLVTLLSRAKDARDALGS